MLFVFLNRRGTRVTDMAYHGTIIIIGYFGVQGESCRSQRSWWPGNVTSKLGGDNLRRQARWQTRGRSEGRNAKGQHAIALEGSGLQVATYGVEIYLVF